MIHLTLDTARLLLEGCFGISPHGLEDIFLMEKTLADYEDDLNLPDM